MSSAQKKESTFDKEVESAPKSAKSTKFFIRKYQTIFIVVLLVAFLTALGAGVYYFIQYQNSQKLLSDPARGAQVETQDLVEKVGKLIELPTSEEPTIATVSDISKLKSQAFFANAQNGDKVLIYTKAKKAVLYRPSTNKIIEFGPINLGSQEQNSASPTVTPTPKPVSIVLRNGTKTVGYAATIEKDLKAKATNLTVASKDNASKSDYVKTLIVDLKGGQKEATAQLVKLLNGEVGELPEGETKPQNADFLVILGKQ